MKSKGYVPWKVHSEILNEMNCAISGELYTVDSYRNFSQEKKNIRQHFSFENNLMAMLLSSPFFCFCNQVFLYLCNVPLLDKSALVRSLAKVGMARCGVAIGEEKMLLWKYFPLVKSAHGSGRLRSTRQSCWGMKTFWDLLLLTTKVGTEFVV